MRKTILSTLLLSSVLSFASPVVLSAPVENHSQSVAATQVELISLNTASVEDLIALPGIGRKKAQAIVQFRDDMGGFKAIEELKDVRGIGEKLFARVSNLVSL